MTALGITIVSLNAGLSMVAAVVLRTPWMRWLAIGCAIIEVAAVAFMIAVVAAYAGAE